MDLPEYRRRYFDAVGAIDQTRLITVVAAEVLTDFPKRLPPELLESISRALEHMVRGLQELLPAIRRDARGTRKKATRIRRSAPGFTLTFDTPAAERTLFLFLTRSLSGEGNLEFDFSRPLYAQQLVMTLAHLDAFLADSLRAACRRESRLLRRGRQLTWEQALNAGGWESLLDLLVDEYCYEFGWKTVSDKVLHLRSELGVPLEPPDDDLLALSEAEQVRHIIIHNGGRVSREFLRRTRRTDLHLDELIPVPAEYADHVATLSAILCADTFIAVSKKFFEATDKDLTGVPRRGHPRQRRRG
jgi:hypothetical protein